MWWPLRISITQLSWWWSWLSCGSNSRTYKLYDKVASGTLIFTESVRVFETGARPAVNGALIGKNRIGTKYEYLHHSFFNRWPFWLIWLVIASLRFWRIFLCLWPQCSCQDLSCWLNFSPEYSITSSCISFLLPCLIMLSIYLKLWSIGRGHVRNIKVSL